MILVRASTHSFGIVDRETGVFKKMRLSLFDIEKLMIMKWWDWPPEKLFIKGVIEMLMGGEDRIVDLWVYYQENIL